MTISHPILKVYTPSSSDSPITIKGLTFDAAKESMLTLRLEGSLTRELVDVKVDIQIKYGQVRMISRTEELENALALCYSNSCKMSKESVDLSATFDCSTVPRGNYTFLIQIRTDREDIFAVSGTVIT